MKNKIKNFEVIIADAPDREMLVAEIWCEEQMIAELNQENEALELQIYLKEGALRLNFDRFLEVLEQAKLKLTNE